MATEEFYIFLPRHPASSATEPLPPDMADGPIDLPDASGVRRSSVILVVAMRLGVEGHLLFVHRFMAVLLAPFGYCRQAPSEPFLHRVREAEEIERGWFLPLPLRVFLRYRPKSTSRVFSGWSVRPYLANRFGRTPITFSASSRCWKHSTGSSAKRISVLPPLSGAFRKLRIHSVLMLL